ncbi:MAG TPA: FGGY family carbohydrate kinase [Sphingobacterium sp.]|nr:FGGY family carbohydrate kinase [Sphingobacterium sp.]
MLLLGIDLGTSSIKVSVVDAISRRRIASAQYPESEAEILSARPGWAEQRPETWWMHTKAAILKAHSTGLYNPEEIGAIGIAYQMHGLVIVDRSHRPLRDAIIWCDSRAVDIGNRAMSELSSGGFLNSHLNSPGNFTASKLAWVKENEPQVYEKAFKFMLPGDYLSLRLTGEVNSNVSSISEGILWNFSEGKLSDTLLKYYGIHTDLVPAILPVFSRYGRVLPEVARELGLSSDVFVTFKAGDQPNNALSLNVLEPGEVAATAGTSGVIYAVTDELVCDAASRVNTFAHVNHTEEATRLGVLLCINGTGIQNSWIKQMTASDLDYSALNNSSASIAVGSEGIRVLPFGNGAERMFNNRIVGGHLENLDFVRHGRAHLWRAAQEGIAFSFRYGLDILRENGLNPSVIKAGHANLFLSPVFQQSFAGVTNVPVELYDNDGSVGAALGAGLGAGVFANREEAFSGLERQLTVEPAQVALYDELYADWKNCLERKLSN